MLRLRLAGLGILPSGVKVFMCSAARPMREDPQYMNEMSGWRPEHGTPVCTAPLNAAPPP
jgi:hypothetical protein